MKKPRNLTAVLTAALLTALIFPLTACFFGGSVSAVTLDITSKTLSIGESMQLTASVTAADEDTDLSVTWSTSKAAVAEVSDSGLVTAKAVGTATITATSKASFLRKATCEITVTDPNAPVVYKNAGTYKTGTDIEAGEYLLITDKQGESILDTGYYQVTLTANAALTSDDFLYNDNFYYRTYVLLEDGQYIKFNGCKLYKLSGYPAVNKNAASLSSGQYKTGTDIDAGEYLLIANKQSDNFLDTGYYKVTGEPNSPLTSADFLYNDNFYYRTYVLLEDGQYLEFNGCKLYKVSGYPAVNKNAAEWHSGQYKAGADLDPGEYKLVPLISDSILSSGYYELTRTPNASVLSADYLDNELFTAQVYVTLTADTYISFTGAKLSKA